MRSISILGEECALYDRLCEMKVEGMTAKLHSSRYEQRRSRNRLKICTAFGRDVLLRRLEDVPRRRSG